MEMRLQDQWHGVPEAARHWGGWVEEAHSPQRHPTTDTAAVKRQVMMTEGVHRRDSAHSSMKSTPGAEGHHLWSLFRIQPLL